MTSAAADRTSLNRLPRFVFRGWAAGPVYLALVLMSCRGPQPENRLTPFVVTHDTACDPAFQSQLEAIDGRLREKHRLAPTQAAAGLLDLKTGRLAMIHPDRIEYAASVPKIGILLAWFELRPQSATNLDAATRLELGQMIKASSNEAASRFSRELGLTNIQDVLDRYGFYDAAHGGGIWVGKHYGKGGERRGDPLADHSHAATVRQLLRFYLMLDQEQLVSPEASRVMREIFDSPGIPHDHHKFVKGLEGRPVRILRKWGSWEDWLHDSALVEGPGRKYILTGLTHHPLGDAYLEDLAKAADDLLSR